MGRFKALIDPYIIGIGINQLPIDIITQEEYDTLSELFKNKPKDPEGYRYMLRADTLEWELVENPIEPEEELYE